MTAQDRAEAYGRAALGGLLSELAVAGAGERNATLNRVAHRAGRLVAAGALDGEAAARELEAAGLALGLQPAEVRSTLRSGQQAGQANPATIPDGEPGSLRRSPTRPPKVRSEQPPDQGPHPRPPRAEVDALWRGCVQVVDDPEVADYLASRAIPPGRVELYDLAHAIPAGARVPKWARCRGVPWSAHHRIVVQVLGATGTVESLHARAVGELPEGLGLEKGLWPAAGPRSARGLVMADGWARQLLATGRHPDGWSGELVVAEGVPDWLSWCVTYSDADESAPAVLGLTAGNWTAEVAARVPDGTRVILATHHDGAGEKYAVTVAATLAGRCEVRRWKV